MAAFKNRTETESTEMHLEWLNLIETSLPSLSSSYSFRSKTRWQWTLLKEKTIQMLIEILWFFSETNIRPDAATSNNSNRSRWIIKTTETTPLDGTAPGRHCFAAAFSAKHRHSSGGGTPFSNRLGVLRRRSYNCNHCVAADGVGAVGVYDNVNVIMRKAIDGTRYCAGLGAPSEMQWPRHSPNAFVHGKCIVSK